MNLEVLALDPTSVSVSERGHLHSFFPFLGDQYN